MTTDSASHIRRRKQRHFVSRKPTFANVRDGSFSAVRTVRSRAGEIPDASKYRGYRRLESDRRGRELGRRNGRAFPATLWPKPSRVSAKLRAE